MTMTLQQIVHRALGWALESSRPDDVLLMSAEELAENLASYDDDLQGYLAVDLVPHVETWLERYAARKGGDR